MECPYSACYTCRRRHVKCDQSQKPCLKCVRSELECFDKRPRTWVKGVAIRGKLRGVKFEDNSATQKSHAAPETIAKDQNNELILSALVTTGLENKGDDGSVIKCAGKLPIAMEDPFIGNWDGISRYYLDYYNERICKLFIVYDSDKNPFRSLMSLAMNNSVLKKAILALAARHRANNALPFLSWDHSNSPQLIDAHRDALLFKHQAIQGLSQTLRDESSSFSDTTVASVFLLIFLDLLESGSDQWNFHLEGAKRLMAMIQPHGKLQDKPQVDPGRTVQGIRDFINSQIYLIETLGATFVRPKLLSQFSRPEHKKGQETVEESFLGCPVFLLTAVQHLSEQRDAIADSGPPGDFLSYHYMSNITEILHFIRSFDCYTWSANQPQDSQYSTHPTNNLHILSRSYQIGAIIYGECIIAAAEGKPFLNDSLVEELIDLITTLKNDHTLFKCILWPIFVAGLECRVQSQRDFLISCLEKFWSDTSCQNVMNAAKILQEYWERNDRPTTGTSQWVFEIGHLGHDWLLI